MGIAGEAHEIGSQFLDRGVIRTEIGSIHRKSLPFHVLIQADPAQGIRLSVKQETLPGIQFEIAVADLRVGDVKHPLALEQFDPDSVEIRILHPIPEMKPGEKEVMAEFIFRICLHVEFPVCLVGKNPVWLEELDPDHDFGLRPARIADFRPHIGSHLVRTDLRRLDPKPVLAIFLGAEVQILHLQKPDLTVKSPVPVEIRRDRSHGKVLPVVADDLDLVDSLDHGLVDLDRERSVASLVVGKHDSVDPDLAGLSGALEVQVMVHLGVLNLEFSAVKGISAIVTVRIAFRSIAAMGKFHLLESLAVLAELPVLEPLLGETANLGRRRQKGKKDGRCREKRRS